MVQRRRILDIRNRDRYITFADDHARADLVTAGVDTTGNGLIDVWEASATTSLAEVFKNDTELVRFYELSYFTGLTELGDSAFYGCTALTSIDLSTLPESITSISGYAFRSCNSLKTVVLPDTVTSLGEYAFGYISTSQKLNINLENITSVGEQCFAYTYLEDSTALWDNLVSIGEMAFANSNISIVAIKDKHTVGDGAFSGSAVTVVDWGKAGTIPANFCYSCPSLTTVVIEQATAIYGGAFGSCVALENVTLPTTVTSISKGAFSSCSKLTAITFNGTKAQWKAITRPSGSFPSTSTVIHCNDGDCTAYET